MHYNIELKKRPQSWTSTPDLDEEDNKIKKDLDVTVKLQIPPQRRHTTTLDLKEVYDNNLKGH